MASILLIEYDPDLRQLLTDILEVEGHLVESRAPAPIGDLGEALREVKPELVVVDIASPVSGDGYDERGMDCLVALRRMPEGREIPVLAYSIDKESLRLQEKLLRELETTIEEDPVDVARMAQAVGRALGER